MARTYVKSGSNLIDIANYIGDLYENSRYYTSREWDSPCETPYNGTSKARVSQGKETGLYFYRARYYSPELGRFVSRDPIDTSDDINLYGYVGNNPTNFTDPLGLWSVSSVVNGIGNAIKGTYNQMKSDLKVGYENGKCIGKQMVKGGLEGDYVEKPTGWNILGQIVAGLTPAGVAADTRDLSYQIKKGDPQGIMLSVVGFVPGAGDLVKGVVKGSKLEAKIVKNLDDVTEVLKAIDKGELNNTVLPAGGKIDKKLLEESSERASEIIAESNKKYADYEGAVNMLDEGKKIEFDRHSLSRMDKRGWTKEKVQDVVNNKNYKFTKKAVDKSTNDSATAYYISDNQYVVINDKTGRVVQVSNLNDPNWAPDTTHY